jgi:hypothetical protein
MTSYGVGDVDDLLFSIDVVESPTDETETMKPPPKPHNFSFKNLQLPLHKPRSVSISENSSIFSPRLVTYTMESLNKIPIPLTNLKKVYRNRPQLVHNQNTFWNEVKDLPLIEKIDFKQVDEYFRDIKNIKENQMLEQLTHKMTNSSGVLDEKQISNVELILNLCKLTPQELYSSMEQFCTILFESSFHDFFAFYSQVCFFIINFRCYNSTKMLEKN